MLHSFKSPHVQAMVLLIATFICYGYNHALMILSPSIILNNGGSFFQAGAQGTIYIFVAVVFRLIFGPLGDKYGVKPIMIAGVLCFLISSLLFPFCKDVWSIILVRCVQALGLSAFFPSSTSTMTFLAPREKVGQYLGVYRFIGSFSLLVFPALSLTIISVFGYTAMFIMFFILLLLAFLATILLPAFKKLLAISSKNDNSIVDVLKSAFKYDTRFVVVILIITFLLSFGFALPYSFVAVYVNELMLDVNIGLYLSLLGAGGLISNIFFGWLSDKYESKTLISIAMLLLGAGISLLSLINMKPTAFNISAILVGFGYSGAIVSVLSAISKIIPPEKRSSVLSMQQNSIDIGIASSSAVFGFIFNLIEINNYVFLVHGIFTSAVAILVIVLRIISMRNRNAIEG